MDDGKETAEMSGADRISVPQLKRLRKLNRKLHDAGVGRPSDGRRGVRIAVREMLSVCFRLQEPTARVVLQSQIEELEETVASQRTVLRKAGEMAVQAGGGGGVSAVPSTTRSGTSRNCGRHWIWRRCGRPPPGRSATGCRKWRLKTAGCARRSPP